MSNMDADLPTLDWLAGVLANHADTVCELKLTTPVVMPGSPIQGLSTRTSAAAAEAFRLIGANYRQMSEATKTARNSYEELDTALADQLGRYSSGEQGR